LPSSVSFLLNAANQLNPTSEIEQTRTFIKSAATNKSDSDSLSDEANPFPTDKRKRAPADENEKERKKKVRYVI